MMEQKERFRLLIQLALVDNEFTESERTYILRLAQQHQIPKEEIEALIAEELQNKDLQVKLDVNIDYETKIEILADLVRVMKSDGEIYLSEIKFCKMIASLFHLKLKSIGILSKMIHNSEQSDWSSVMSRMEKMKLN